MVTSFIASEPYKITHSNGRHTFYADEPHEKGGGDTAPSPDELLESALASCTLATLRMYTDHKRWDVGNIHVSVELERKDGKSILTRELKFEYEITPEQKQRLELVAHNCPVSKTLKGGPELIVKII